MRLRVLSWIGILWGSFILISGIVRVIGGQQLEGAYAIGTAVAWVMGGLMLFAGIRTLRGSAGRAKSPLEEFAREYTASWCSLNPNRVAAHYAERGALTINGGPPAVGRAAIAETAGAFMTAYPDMVVVMDRLETEDGRIEYHWTFTGTNSGPGGTGNPVRISGHEEWFLGDDGLIVDSQGYFDQAEWDRQVRGAAAD